MDKPEAPQERPTRVAEAFERIWGLALAQVLTAVSAAEDEALRALQRASALAGWSQDEAMRQVREFSERLAAQRREVERMVEDSVRRALSPLILPRRDQIQDVDTRLKRVSERLDELEKRK
jgi:alanyl-tRNA synthetase